MSIFRTKPAVFAVGDTYQIMIPVTAQTLMWVKVNDECYYDESNGIMRSRVTVHRISVPMEELDRAGKYTVCWRKIIERKPYFTETEDECQESFNFYPVKGEEIRAYHIADAHNYVTEPCNCAEKFQKEFGKLDFLILNGDIPDHSGKIENFDNIYEIVSNITNGNIPTVFSRGNHDTRGIFAENIADYTPNQNGNSYFTFKLGDIWGVVLDCGEDKDDSHPEYGHTVCCTYFRKKQTKFIEKIIENAKENYTADDVKYKLVVVHNPFTERFNPPFNIEEDIYSYWAKLLRENVKPDVMICGHKHSLEILEVGGEKDALGQPCTVVVGSDLNRKENYYAGAGYIFKNGKITVVFNDSEKIILSKEI